MTNKLDFCNLCSISLPLSTNTVPYTKWSRKLYGSEKAVSDLVKYL